jgi:hypothetical protein
VIAAGGTTFLVLVSICLTLWLGKTLYKHFYIEDRKQEIVDLVVEHTPPDTSITVSQIHIGKPAAGGDLWFLIYFTLTLETTEDLSDSFDLYETPSAGTSGIQRVSCAPPEKSRNESAGTSVYKLECMSWARCSVLSLLLVDRDS